MKYPQLVSTRAVNAISDWLVSRLEQLGVEAPLIYSRLLLSLLQSSVQINDPIEFNNLEKFLANRKGHNKRYPPCDKDALKKITAVQCLTEIVSSEQEITIIENLVDELCEKLNVVEEQLTNVEEDGHQLLHATISLTPDSNVRNNNNNTSNSTDQNHNTHHTSHRIRTTSTFGSRLNSTSSSTSSLSGTTSAIAKADIEDPRKRYYKAFPALTKDMDDSLRTSKRNVKSLTWPLDRRITSSFSLANKFEKTFKTVAVASPGLNKKANFATELKSSEAATATTTVISSIFPEAVNNQVHQQTALLGLKRKTKRRRNQALSKGKSGNITRKNPYNGRMASPTCWDTDFEGSWEMGRDLIKEFIVKENNRNRSTSESAAYSMNQNHIQGLHEVYGCNEDDESNFEKRKKPMGPGDTLPDRQSIENYANGSKLLKTVSNDDCTVDISFCEHITPPSSIEHGVDDTLATVSDITDSSLNTARRLYERDISNDSLNFDSEQNDFAQFKAKFNRNVEALWKNTTTNEINNVTINSNPMTSSSSIAGLSVPAATIFKENLHNFWSNYYITTNNQQPLIDDVNTKRTSSASLISRGGTLIGDSSTSDYHSMSSNIDGFDKSVGASLKKLNDKNTPIGVFLQNSIWSENTNCNYSDTDETFSFKVWNSLKNDSIKMDCANENQYCFPYNKSKWSEGINVGPNPSYFERQKQNQPSLLPQSQQSSSSLGKIPSTSSLSLVDHSARRDFGLTAAKDSLSNSAVIASSVLIGGNVNWQTPDRHNLQADLKSWNSSNPMSLPEMYASNNNIASETNFFSNNHKCNLNSSHTIHSSPSTSSCSLSSPGSSSCSSMSTNITLTNHSTSSGFVEYAHIKSLMKLNDTIGSNGRKCCDASQPKTDASKLYHRIDSNAFTSATSSSTSSSYPDEENLLTSERTHFHPIKSYADGHCFDISSSLDVIDYDRSQSGYLYFDSEKYLEYTRLDTFLSDEENVLPSNTTLYSLSNYPNANVAPNALNVSSSSSAAISVAIPDFVIKFRVRNNEIACQTDLPISVMSVKLNQSNYILSPDKRKINAKTNTVVLANSNTSANIIISHQTPELKVAATAVVASTETTLWNEKNNDCMDGAGKCERFQPTETGNLEHWSMIEIGKRCIDNNNSSHTLWGMCSACNNDMKSIPADRMLKDELNVEADQIMSDLKYMQDLYIGSDWENDDDDDDDKDEDEFAEADEEVEVDAKRYDNENDHMFNSANEKETDKTNKVEHHNQDILFSVNKLIANLLRPPNNRAVLNSNAAVKSKPCFIPNSNNDNMEVSSNFNVVLSENCGDTMDMIVEDKNCSMEQNNNEKYVGGLLTCDENIIWKKELKPINIIAHLKNNNNNMDNSFLEKLNWEYSNLAEIWAKESPCKSVENSYNRADQNKKDNCTVILQVDPKKQLSQCEENSHDKRMSSVIPSVEQQQQQQQFSEPRSSSDCRRVQSFLNSTRLKIANRFDRKRRHSASQNFFCSNNNCNSGINYNNNNTNICNKNNINSKFNICEEDLQTTFIDLNNVDSTCDNKDNANASQEIDGDNKKNVECISKQCDTYDQFNDEPNLNSHETIITCKYWTTVKPISPVDYEHFGDSRPSSALFIEKSEMTSIALNTSSILRHVTMISRPLTR